MESLNILFTGQDAVEVRSEPLREIGPNQLLIQTTKTLISTGTEGIILGRKFAPGTHWDNWIKYPFYPGYLHAGKVLSVGQGVEDFQPGDSIASRGPHQQFVLRNTSEVLRVPDDVAEEDAAWFGLAKITQIGVRRAAHELGDVVVIVGCGLLGQLVTQYVRLAGAREVIVIDTAPARLEMALSHGATHALQMSVADAKPEIEKLTNGRGADVVYDITGHPQVFAHALGLARRFGKLILLGDTGTPAEQRLTSDVIARGVNIIGAHDGHAAPLVNDFLFWTQENMAKLFFTYLQRGQMRVGDLVTHRFSPHEAPQAYQMLQTDRTRAMGVIFDWAQV